MPYFFQSACLFFGALLIYVSSPVCLPKFAIASSATSNAISSVFLPSTFIPIILATCTSFLTSFILKPCASPFATARRVNARSRPWSEWAAVPAATYLATPLAAMVAAVAPQMPVISSLSLPTILHGPIKQCLQHMPSRPIGQGFITSALSNMVDIPSFLAFSSICCDAGSIDFSVTGITFFSVVVAIFNAPSPPDRVK